MAWDGKVDVLVIGGGMICEDMVLPTLFQERRRGNVGRLQVVSLNAGIIKRLREVFPDEEFEGIPDPDTHPLDKDMPTEYKRLIAELRLRLRDHPRPPPHANDTGGCRGGARRGVHEAAVSEGRGGLPDHRGGGAQRGLRLHRVP